MGLTKEQRIGILLGIDGVFFLVELSVGYAVHSLALVADAFHMVSPPVPNCPSNLLTPASVERCLVPLCRSVGRTCRKYRKLEYVHLWLAAC
jgi:hypothetical protein